MRAKASPLVIFLRVPVGSQMKGFVKFVGLGVVDSAMLRMQYNTSHGFFPNFVFGIKLLSLENEGNQLDWNWINARRTKSTVLAQKIAPISWTKWVETGVSK